MRVLRVTGTSSTTFQHQMIVDNTSQFTLVQQRGCRVRWWSLAPPSLTAGQKLILTIPVRIVTCVSSSSSPCVSKPSFQNRGDCDADGKCRSVCGRFRSACRGICRVGKFRHQGMLTDPAT